MLDVSDYFAVLNDGLDKPCYLSVARNSTISMPLLAHLRGGSHYVRNDARRFTFWAERKAVEQALRSVFRRRGISLMLSPYLPGTNECLFPVVYLDPGTNNTERLRNELYITQGYTTTCVIHQHTITITITKDKRPQCPTTLI